MQYRNCIIPTIEEKSSWNNLQINADNLTSEIFVHKALRWARYYVWFQNSSELYNYINSKSYAYRLQKEMQGVCISFCIVPLFGLRHLVWAYNKLIYQF